MIGNGSVNSGNNTGGGVNIAIIPPNSVNVGNCSSSMCVNLYGVQLMGGDPPAGQKQAALIGGAGLVAPGPGSGRETACSPLELEVCGE
jgi:hypothetical protein